MRLIRQDGFTLVELLVATALAGIGFLGLAALHAGALRATSLGRNTSLATALASDQLEAMRRVPTSTLASVDAQTVNVGTQYFTREVAVAGAPVGDAKQVTVNISWGDQLGAHLVRLVTVIGP